MTGKDIWEKVLEACDDASLEAWETATYWGSVRPVLEEELSKLRDYHVEIVRKLRGLATSVRKPE